MIRSLSALGLVLFLAACGGGGGGIAPTVLPDPDPVPVPDPAPTPEPAPDPAPSLTGLAAPTFTDAEIVPKVVSIYNAADTLIVGDVPITFDGKDYIAYTLCEGAACRSYETTSGATFDWDLSVGDTGAWTFSGVGEKHGVMLAEGQTVQTVAGQQVTASGYSGWMVHSYFDIGHAAIDGGAYDGLLYSAASSLGNATGSQPAGNATWRGLMIGATDINGPTETLQGDATVAYDLSSNELDVGFAGIYNLDTGMKHAVPAMQWNDVPVASDGSFRRAVSSTSDVRGRFYGPDHAEVGGVFHHSTAIGSFGAKK